MKITQKNIYSVSNIGETNYFLGLSEQQKKKHLNVVSRNKLKQFYTPTEDGGVKWDWWKIVKMIRLFLNIISAIVKSNESEDFTIN